MPHLVHAHAQTDPQCVFERYTSLDGLPNNNISDMCYDSQGFLWICTRYGLSRFDGYTFKNYQTLPGDYSPLSHNRFLRIKEDAGGYLWLTTYDNHLFRFDRKREIFEDVPHSDPQFASKNYKIDDFLCASTGDTWISVSGVGLLRSHKPTEKEPLRITSYFEDNDIGKNISLLFEDTSSDIWVVSEAGVTHLSPDKNGVYGSTIHNRNKGVVALIGTGDNIVFAAGSTLLILDRTCMATEEIEVCLGDRITTLAASNDGNTVYIGTAASGIAEYDLRECRLTKDKQRPGRIRDIVVDSKGLLWVTTADAGITRYDAQLKDYKHFSQKINTFSYYIDTVTKIVDRGDKVWVKMNNVGFGYYDRETDRLMPFFNDPDNGFSSMSNGVACFLAEDNVLWVSTNMRGLDRITFIDHKAEIFEPRSDIRDMASKEIRAMMFDSQKNMWLANKSGEIFCYSPERSLLRKYDSTNSPFRGRAYCMKEDSKGNIWVGTKDDGLYRMTPHGREYRFKHFMPDPDNRFSINSDIVYWIEEDTHGRLWFASYGEGLMMLENSDSETFITLRNSFPRFPIYQAMKMRCLIQYDENHMIASTVEGLVVFNPNESPETMNFRMVQKIPGDLNSPGNNDIIHMMRDSEGNIWLSTYGGGLNKLTYFNEDGVPRFNIYSTEHGLASNITFAATEDKNGNIWVATENGISMFDVLLGRFNNLSNYDGIPPAIFSETTALTDSKGLVYFGSTENIFVLDPNKQVPRVQNFKLIFTNLEIRNKEVNVDKGSPLTSSISGAVKITLPHDYSIFRIEYASLNFEMQPRLSYMYRLEGFDKDWTLAKDTRSASYSNVPHGSYTLRVRTFADDDLRVVEEKSIDITILPPWWKSTLAYILYFVAGIIIFYVGIRILLTVMKLRNKVRVEQEMTELKLQFFTNISHELRTPLTLILGGVDDVRKNEKLSGKGNSSITLAYKNSRRMLNLINQLLDFRKIVNNKMKIKVRREDVIPIASGVVDDFREMAAEHRIELLFAISDRSIFAWIDPERIEWVVYNLMSNAFKFTPDGGKVELSVSKKESEGFFTISVRDNGIGLTKENIEIIFERFAQASGSVAPGYKGTGIGLALCKEITELHHGTISVESKPNEGSLFTVRIPLGNSHFNMDQIDFSVGDAVYSSRSEYMLSVEDEAINKYRTDAQPPQGAYKVMLVEDNYELRTFIYNHLIHNYFVMEAVDGADALEQIKTEQPDIIVTDLMMPNMDGNELTQRVRADFNTSHIPIIMLTAKPEAETRIEAMKYGADGYITKPFSIELLLARIDNLLTTRVKLFEKYSSEAANAPRVIDLSPTEIVVTDRDEEFIRKTMDWIDQNIENSDLTIEQLALHLGLGRTTMYNKLKSITGKSPVELIKEYRMNKAKKLLGTGQYSISEVAYKVGFNDPGYFSKCFREQYKVSPAEFLRDVKKDKE